MAWGVEQGLLDPRYLELFLIVTNRTGLHQVLIPLLYHVLGQSPNQGCTFKDFKVSPNIEVIRIGL
jgi:hypothetical protein